MGINCLQYSMGAVVARVALNDARLKQLFHDKLYTFVSVAGPHLGNSGSDSALVGIGQWALMRWKKVYSLSQLALDDGFLLNLARESSMLGEFQTVALVSSSTDTYVPAYSARVEIPAGTNSISPIAEMQRALSSSLSRVPVLSKVELDFNFESKTRNTRERLDVMLGRASHVHILDSVPLTLTLTLIFGEEWFE